MNTDKHYIGVNLSAYLWFFHVLGLKYGIGHLSEGTGNREQGTGNREQGTGNREQGTGNRE